MIVQDKMQARVGSVLLANSCKESEREDLSMSHLVRIFLTRNQVFS